MQILVNLPAGFYEQPELEAVFARLDALGTVRKRSHDTPEQIADDLAWAEAVVMWSWPELSDELLDAVPALRYRGHIDISQRGATVAVRRNVPVSLSKGGWSPAVSEMALTLMLGALRRSSDYHRAMRAGDERWVQTFPTDIDPTERQLTGRSVGIVGFGRIGQRLAELLQPFHVTLRVVDPYLPTSIADSFGAEVVDIDTLCRLSEVLVLCAASNDGTRRLIGSEQIAAMPPHAVLINVARAALIDVDALVQRLQRGDLIAAMDVFDTEPLPTDSPLRNVPNLHLTPHRAGGVMESVQRTLAWLIDDLEAVSAGRSQQHPLTERMISGLDA